MKEKMKHILIAGLAVVATLCFFAVVENAAFEDELRAKAEQTEEIVEETLPTVALKGYNLSL